MLFDWPLVRVVKKIIIIIIIIISLFCIAPNPYVVQSASQLKVMILKTAESVAFSPTTKVSVFDC